MFLAFLFLICFLVSKTSYAKIVEQIGEACHRDFQVAQEEALKQAKARAVETYIGTLVDSRILVINSKLMRKTIQTMALGKVKLVEKPFIISAEPLKEKGIICVKLKAKFEIDKSQFYRANFGLKMILNKKEFKPGEELKVYLYAQKKCYPYLFSVDAEGNVYRLLPNFIEKSPVIEKKMEFPTPKMQASGISLVVVPNPRSKSSHQVEELIFICTRKKENALYDLFPEAFVMNEESLKKLSIPFPIKVEKLAEILEQIGLENYEMIDDFYWVVKEKNINKINNIDTREN